MVDQAHSANHGYELRVSDSDQLRDVTFYVSDLGVTGSRLQCWINAGSSGPGLPTVDQCSLGRIGAPDHESSTVVTPGVSRHP